MRFAEAVAALSLSLAVHAGLAMSLPPPPAETPPEAAAPRAIALADEDVRGLVGMWTRAPDAQIGVRAIGRAGPEPSLGFEVAAFDRADLSHPVPGLAPALERLTGGHGIDQKRPPYVPAVAVGAPARAPVGVSEELGEIGLPRPDRAFRRAAPPPVIAGPSDHGSGFAAPDGASFLP